MRHRIFTVNEANALLPHFRRVFRRVGELMAGVRTYTDRLKVLEVIWADAVLVPGNPDFEEFRSLRERVGRVVSEIEDVIEREVLARGVRFPPGGIEHGLLDFPTTLDGRWVYLCWRLGEPEIRAWHEVRGGFSGRKPLTARLAKRMGRRGSRPGGLGPGREA